MRRVWAILMVSQAIGCGTPTPPVDATADARGVDASTTDTGALDTGARDSGALDSGALDTGTLDSGALDTGTLDSGGLDTGTLDSGGLDTGTLDSGGLDANAPDTGLNGCDAVVSFDPFYGFDGSTFAGAPSASGGSCDPGVHHQRIFSFVAPVGVSTLAGGASIGATAHVRTACGDLATEISCAEPTATFAVTPGTTYFLFLDETSEPGGFNVGVVGTLAPGSPCVTDATSILCPVRQNCVPSTPGSLTGTCTSPRCEDLADDDGDGLTDYPADPGCLVPEDDDETDPVVAPACANGMDDDRDGATDYPADLGCTAASDATEDCDTFAMEPSGYVGCATTATVPPCPDIAATGTMNPCIGGSCGLEVPIGFAFEFFGGTATTITQWYNGTIGFPGSSVHTNECSVEGIAVFWDDLDASGGRMYYQTLGSAPNRRFVANWRLPHATGGTPIDVRAVLAEGTNFVTLCYVATDTGMASTALGASATAGIGPLTYSCNEPRLPPGTVLHFTAP